MSEEAPVHPARPAPLPPPNDHATVFTAATAGRWAPVEAAILAGFDVNDADEYGYTLLHHAAGYSKPPSLRIVCMLLERGTNVDALSHMRGVALHWAANGADAPIVRALCRAGADTNAVSAYGWTPLMDLCLTSRGSDPVKRALEILKVPSLNIDFKWRGGNMAHWARARGNVAVAEVVETEVGELPVSFFGCSTGGGFDICPTRTRCLQ